MKPKLIKNDNYEDMLQEARMYSIIAPAILPLIEKRKRDAHGRLIQSYRSGKTENLTIVAELSVLSDLEQEINSKRMIYDTLEGAQNGNARE